MASSRLLILIEIAIMSGLAFVLSFVKIGVFWAYGGSISLVMLPIVVMAFRRGWKAGIVTGLIVGLLKLIGGYVVHPVQLVLDYPLPFLTIGLASLFAVKGSFEGKRFYAAMIGGVLFASFLRFLCHFTSGIVWFGEYAPEGTPVALYSFVYNISYVLPEALISIIVLALFGKKYSQMFQPKKELGV
ncbi:energy-coupled thiamine transporter ThiT [Halalkalibacterium halodurans]|jgi:thiamine transporter|uniref:BH0830 protein n=2 Tax=Halalkalibacterium halodurans TaxID=86665 RepID=Q9KEM2_HALH5|nr:energy-coupled thiamine transporter ThiT [Halalkalibacterium halodurans]MDY7221329.1 energy-coupled thiamine transporter ThiT [Halalkalibacterium halodurans]MDY7240568.1 energy-coupled thiamine transporter ThiT [Halalkalibacterium halodurans]MED3648453.1 energy-coupled thiamine transporter ThiT [Halalkalibacterium halodurans]MED4081398.1 energy-coupled thiamine transporter ThiT [Halalkalibacterium halodurans]MED4083320.1 energy-coupled thiamine transporter ThiT [Halalkalibacterium haloduran